MLITALITGFATFTVTNLDDIVILTLLFAQVNDRFRPWQIVAGQYLGFSFLILVSLIGFLSHSMIPTSLIRLLGLFPLGIGLVCLLKEDETDETAIEISEELFPKTGLFGSVLTVAGITIANGGDNLGIYVPLFANSTIQSLLIILAIFMILIGVWCYVAYKLTNLRAIAQLITDYGNNFVPSIFIALGVLIIKENMVTAFLALGITSLWLLTAFMRSFASQGTDDTWTSSIVGFSN